MVITCVAKQLPMTRNQLISKEEIFQTKQLNTERYLRFRGESEVVITGLTRKVADLITLQLAKAREFFVYLANASFFLNFG